MFAPKTTCLDAYIIFVCTIDKLYRQSLLMASRPTTANLNIGHNASPIFYFVLINSIGGPTSVQMLFSSSSVRSQISSSESPKSSSRTL